jgi:sporulation protein YlmC with PRC-barrel domain
MVNGNVNTKFESEIIERNGKFYFKLLEVNYQFKGQHIKAELVAPFNNQLLNSSGKYLELDLKCVLSKPNYK